MTTLEEFALSRSSSSMPYDERWDMAADEETFQEALQDSGRSGGYFPPSQETFRPIYDYWNVEVSENYVSLALATTDLDSDFDLPNMYGDDIPNEAYTLDDIELFHTSINVKKKKQSQRVVNATAAPSRLGRPSTDDSDSKSDSDTTDPWTKSDTRTRQGRNFCQACQVPIIDSSSTSRQQDDVACWCFSVDSFPEKPQSLWGT